MDVGLIGGESVRVTEFRGVKEDAMGRRGGVRGEGGPAGAGNQEGGEDSLMIVEEEVGVAKHVAGVEEMEVGSGEENIVGDGIRESGGGGADTGVGDVAWGGEGEPSVENEGGCVGGEGEKVASAASSSGIGGEGRWVGVIAAAGREGGPRVRGEFGEGATVGVEVAKEEAGTAGSMEGGKDIVEQECAVGGAVGGGVYNA